MHHRQRYRKWKAPMYLDWWGRSKGHTPRVSDQSVGMMNQPNGVVHPSRLREVCGSLQRQGTMLPAILKVQGLGQDYECPGEPICQEITCSDWEKICGSLCKQGTAGSDRSVESRSSVIPQWRGQSSHVRPWTVGQRKVQFSCGHRLHAQPVIQIDL